LKSTVLFIIAAVWCSPAGRHGPASAGYNDFQWREVE
jgi:hypothetical protein